MQVPRKHFTERWGRGGADDEFFISPIEHIYPEFTLLLQPYLYLIYFACLPVCLCI